MKARALVVVAAVTAVMTNKIRSTIYVISVKRKKTSLASN